MSNQPIIEGLRRLLADSYTLMLKTQNYHWNVTGPGFKGLHELFELQYNDLFAANDVIAERIRALGEKAPGSYKEFASLAAIKEATGAEKAAEMVANLAADHAKLATSITQLIEAAGSAGDEGTADILSPRISAHQKHAWMLKSSQ